MIIYSAMICLSIRNVTSYIWTEIDYREVIV